MLLISFDYICPSGLRQEERAHPRPLPYLLYRACYGLRLPWPSKLKSIRLHAQNKSVEMCALCESCPRYHTDIVEEDAAFLEILLINHPLIDGNKRVALAACDVFLRINGGQLTAASDWIYDRMMVWITEAEDRLELIKQDLKICKNPIPDP